MNSSTSGHIGEKLFEIKALKNGWEVCQPVFALPYDYLVLRDEEEGWIKVQVKKAYTEVSKAGMDYARVTLSRSGSSYKKRPYKEEDFDYLAIVIPEEDCVYMMSFEEMGGREKITKPINRRKKIKYGRKPVYDWDKLEI